MLFVQRMRFLIRTSAVGTFLARRIYGPFFPLAKYLLAESHICLRDGRALVGNRTATRLLADCQRRKRYDCYRLVL